jgi:hypothetical protein
MMEWNMPRKIYGVTAQQTTNTSGNPERLTVKAVVQTLGSGEKLSLLEAPVTNKPQVGVLTLEVQVETGTGADVLGSTTVEYANRTFENQYYKVTVITDDNSSTVNIQTI